MEFIAQLLIICPIVVFAGCFFSGWAEKVYRLDHHPDYRA